ncbi:enoyl-CoA hydratase/isomerase family protein [Mycolicibacterium smegmatis]|uniref:Probable enoyl-CoA hydratase EchA17 n=1 Tax=Mycolicibacterium smegmatis (strain MKD8) TaxID=1214915 RepID=A0A2U9PIM5_MYCSE|nr:enoyl-CoA hydratase-related protein [Mycolicibacterium smegmatis]AWT51587.1 3-hydroxybutyryl-CoA dehydratase [Mycolicibacterium smegmatis MKD8]
MSVLDVERTGDIVTLTINRPEAFNALNTEVIGALEAEVGAAAAAGLRAVIITGAGEKAFSAGADLKEIAVMGPDQARETMTRGQRSFRAIEQAPIPVVAAVNGLALGGGFELILACTIPVLSTKAAMGLPESGLGLIPGYGGTQRLPRVLGEKVAAHLMLTGTRLDADRAYMLGLTPLPPVEPSDLLPAAKAVADKIAAQGPLAVRAILRALDVGRDAPVEAGLAVETGLAALAVAGAESGEGVAAFLERRPAKFANPEGQL